MAGPMEATEGMSPEIVTHDEQPAAGLEDVGPEEAAIRGPDGQYLAETAETEPKIEDENEEQAALAEGRDETGGS